MLPHQSPNGPAPRTGLLLAAGIIAIVEAAPLVVIGVIAFFSGSRSRGDGWGDLIATLGAIIAVIGAAWLVAGIGGVLRQQWGRVMLIIGNSLGLLLSINSLQQKDNSGAFVPLLLSLIGLLLGAFGQPRRLDRGHIAPMGGLAGGLAAGWRPDPYGRFQMRYWDGAAWTDQVSTGGRRQVDPMGASTVIPFATPPSAFPELPTDETR